MVRISKKCPVCKKLYQVEFEMGDKKTKDMKKAEKELALLISECQYNNK